MKRNYRLGQRLMAYILLFSFFLQSCTSFSKPFIPIKEHQAQLNQREDSSDIAKQAFMEEKEDKKFIAQGGHIVAIHEQDGQLQAIVEENLPEGFSRQLTLPVYKEPVFSSIKSLSQHSPAYHKHHIYVYPPEKDKQGKGYVYVGSRGLRGGMEDKNVGSVDLRIGKESEKRQTEEKKELEEDSSPDLEDEIDLEEGGNFNVVPYESSVQSTRQENKPKSEGLVKYCSETFSKINSVEEYEKAKKTINIIINWKNEYGKVASDNNIDDKLDLISAFSKIYPYVNEILGADFFGRLPEEDQLKLVDLYYDLNFQIAGAHIQILTLTTLNQPEIQKHVKSHKEAKIRLRASFNVSKKKPKIDYLKELSDLYDIMDNSYPQIRVYFYPETLKQLFQPRRFEVSQRRGAVKRKNKNKQIEETAKSIENPSPEVIFLMDLRRFIEELVDSCNKKEIVTTEEWQKKCEEFKALELRGYLLHSLVETLDNSDDPKVNTMINFYRQMAKISPKFDMYRFIKWGIILYIKANDLSEAMLRIKAMEGFCTSALLKGQEGNFKSFQAAAYALCGEHDKLSEINQNIIQEALARKKKIEENRQKKVQKIKDAQRSQVIPVPNPNPAQSTKIKQIVDKNALSDELGSESAFLEGQKSSQELKEEKRERHQQSEEKREQERLLEEKAIIKEAQSDTSRDLLEATEQASDSSLSKTHSPIKFLLPKRAVNTVSQIFSNDWKVTRGDIENLFQHLGQNIDIKTKSSHHIVKITTGIALATQEGKIITAITELSADMKGHLSLPDWEDKVPVYMQSQIQNFLHIIGIKEGNYSKGNADERIQFVPVQNNSVIPTSTSDSESKQSQDGNNKKKKKKSKKGEQS